MQLCHPFSPAIPILVKTCFTFTSVAPAGVVTTGCRAGGRLYRGIHLYGASGLSVPVVVSVCSRCLIHPMVTVSVVSTVIGGSMLHPVLPICTWHALRHHPRHDSNSGGMLGAPESNINALILACSSHGVRGVVIIHSTSPAGIMSTIVVSTSTFTSSCFGVYINTLLLASP